MYLSTSPDKLWFFDLETDSLIPSKIWCGVFKNKQTQQVYRFINDGSSLIYHELHKFVSERLLESAVFCAHNGISFDGPTLARLAGCDIPLGSLVDTLVLSYLYNPALEGGHSLEAYGERLKFPKVAHDDWTTYSPAMLNRCEQDVELLEKVYDALTSKMTKIGFSELSCEIEHKTRRIVDRQTAHGFWFDKARGEELLHYLRGRESDLAVPIQRLFPPKLEELGTYSRRKRQDGSDFASYQKHLAKYPSLRDNGDGTYTCFDYFPFNIGSPVQRLDRLMGLGYDPTAKTPKGNPKVDEESLLKFAEECGREEVKLMAEWLVCNGRANMVQTWLNYVGADSRIHGRLLTCGATTRRMIHSAPNTANIPSGAKAAYGHECRSLWSVEPARGLCLVGADAAGLETVGLCHYLGSPRATEALTGAKPNDVHTLNSQLLTRLLGRPVDREWGAKTGWYAFLYGAYPKKLGEIVKGPPTDGEIMVKAFFKTVPGLERLVREVQDEWQGNRGLLKTIDGGYVRCPSVNAALNYRIQSLGAIVMKLAAILLDTTVKTTGLQCQTVGTIHDEWQMEVRQTEADQLGKLAVQAIGQAAEELNFKVPLGGDYKIGGTWSETH